MLLVALNSWPHRFVPAHGRSGDKAASQSARPLPLHTRGRERLGRPLPFLDPFLLFPAPSPSPAGPWARGRSGAAGAVASRGATLPSRAGGGVGAGLPGGLDSRHPRGGGREGLLPFVVAFYLLSPEYGHRLRLSLGAFSPLCFPKATRTKT